MQVHGYLDKRLISIVVYVLPVNQGWVLTFYCGVVALSYSARAYTTSAFKLLKLQTQLANHFNLLTI